MKKIIILSLSIIFLFGCMTRNIVPRNYFILEYYSHSEKDELRLDEPFDQSVYIEDTKVPRTYNRNQIVVRHFGPRITYSDNNLWGVKLSKIIPDLIKKRFDGYNMFKNTQRELFTSDPDYVIDTKISNIEMYISETLYQARLNIDFTYRKKDTEKPLITHSANIERVLLKQDFDTFAQTINDIILDEIDRFAAKINIHNIYGSQSLITQDNISVEIDPALVEILDSEEDNSGKGLILVPAITRTENEPYYKVYDKYGYERSAKIGEALPLMEGTYSIEYGSGNKDQKMTQKNIKVHPRYKTIVEPDWGCLIVEIIDENRNFAKVIYELFGLEDGESFGSEFPAEVELGEQEKVWVLKPGHYKITINNEPFNTYTDFTTVLIEKGSVQKLTIVMGTDEEGNPTNMAGAGILEESFFAASLEPLKFSSAIHINGNLNSDNELNEDDPEVTITMNSQLENYLIYDKDPLYYNMKSVIDLGISKTTDTDFRLASDEFALKNTGIYYFVTDLGFYGRFDINSHFFNETQYNADEFYYQKFDENGIVLGDSIYSDNVQTKSSLFPIELKEGIGINYRILNLSRASLSFRAGFGIRQFFNEDVFVYNDEKIDIYDPASTKTFVDAAGVEHRKYFELASTNTTGTELSLVGNFQLPFNLTYSMDADFYFPFEENDEYTFEWENSFNLNLFKHISLDYKFNLKKRGKDSGIDYLVQEHSLFLRVTYFLR
ncbi:MAG: DUF481 domain-containing protein [Candidatus Cloacimonadota bacterium]|nr:DUF481 domain-containing protein [Candidatus Cloacimonadota bacterium]